MNIKIKAKKSLGQNFLQDENIINKIISTISDIKNSVIIEIGPGAGALTKAILKENPKHLIAIEFDKNVIPHLENLQNNFKNNFTIINDDALKISEEEIVKKFISKNEKIKIVSNLPYNISAVLLIKWLKKINLFSELILMFQKEVAYRIKAEPKTKEYGRLSIIAQSLCNIKLICNVPPTAFFPQPKIYSSVLKFIPKENIEKFNFDILEKIVKASFANRRKMIKSSLKTLIKDAEKIDIILKKAGINPNYRAEELEVNKFILLSKAFENL